MHLPGLRAVHAADDFARQCIEGLPRAGGSLIQQRKHKAIRDRARIKRTGNRALVARLRDAGESESGACCAATSASASPTTASAATTCPGSRVVAGKRQRHAVCNGVITEGGSKKSHIGGNAAGECTTQSRGAQNPVRSR